MILLVMKNLRLLILQSRHIRVRSIYGPRKCCFRGNYRRMQQNLIVWKLQKLFRNISVQRQKYSKMKKILHSRSGKWCSGKIFMNKYSYCLKQQMCLDSFRNTLKIKFWLFKEWMGLMFKASCFVLVALYFEYRVAEKNLTHNKESWIMYWFTKSSSVGENLVLCFVIQYTAARVGWNDLCFFNFHDNL